MIPKRVFERLLINVTVVGGCLMSNYSTGSHGYAQIGWYERGKTRMVLAHRAAWVAAHGPIPSGMTVDHVCKNRRCIRIEHLRLLSKDRKSTRLNSSHVEIS